MRDFYAGFTSANARIERELRALLKNWEGIIMTINQMKIGRNALIACLALTLLGGAVVNNARVDAEQTRVVLGSYRNAKASSEPTVRSAGRAQVDELLTKTTKLSIDEINLKRAAFRMKVIQRMLEDDLGGKDDYSVLQSFIEIQKVVQGLERTEREQVYAAYDLTLKFALTESLEKLCEMKNNGEIDLESDDDAQTIANVTRKAIRGAMIERFGEYLDQVMENAPEQSPACVAMIKVGKAAGQFVDDKDKNEAALGGFIGALLGVVVRAQDYAMRELDDVIGSGDYQTYDVACAVADYVAPYALKELEESFDVMLENVME